MKPHPELSLTTLARICLEKDRTPEVKAYPPQYAVFFFACLTKKNGKVVLADRMIFTQGDVGGTLALFNVSRSGTNRSTFDSEEVDAYFEYLADEFRQGRSFRFCSTLIVENCMPTNVGG